MMSLAFAVLFAAAIVAMVVVLAALALADAAGRSAEEFDHAGHQRTAWLVMIVLVPIAGPAAYFLLARPVLEDVRRNLVVARSMRRGG